MDSVGEMPTTFKPAIKSSDATKWKEACDSECDSLLKNDIWDVVPLPKGRKAIGCRWVFRIKENQDGEVKRYKAQSAVATTCVESLRATCIVAPSNTT